MNGSGAEHGREAGPASHGEELSSRLGEFEAIERIKQLFPGSPAGETWIGDDAAVLGLLAGRPLLAADSVVEGIHADLRLTTIADFGWKSVVVNVSDIAAMGGAPKYAVVTVAAPPGTDLVSLYEGIAGAANQYGCPVVGGDLSASSSLVVTVAILGETGSREPVLRRGARPGDILFVTGELGGSAAGLRNLRQGISGDLGDLHRRPRARVEEGRAAADGGATAMIDISDGLSSDVMHLARGSGVGVALEKVPVAHGATLEEALNGGEDYELLIAAADESALLASFRARSLKAPIRIGSCTGDPTERRLGKATLEPRGYQHFR